jgi:hypothetical protein
MQSILNKLGITDTLNKSHIPKKVKYNKVKNNVALMEGMNYMADLLYLPKTKEGYKYCFVIVDLATDAFDIEPIQNKTPETTLKAMQSIFKRKYLKHPYASLRTDDGAEFKGVFHKYLYGKNILHRFTMPYRHNQMSNVESLNKQLGTIFNLYCAEVEKITGSYYREWTDILETVRKDLNKARKKKLTKKSILEQPVPDFDVTTKYKVGDMVYYKLSYPQNAFGEKQPTANFRVGDLHYSYKPYKIDNVIFMNDAPYVRYVLNDVPNVAFYEYELLPYKGKSDTPIFKIKKILEKKKIKNKPHYLVWFKNQKKANAEWISVDDLNDKGYKKEVQEFENTI